MKKIYSRGLAKELVGLGYKIIGYDKDEKYGKDIYIFEESIEFYKDLNKLCQKFKTIRKDK